jgi:hypothetical protein
VFEILRFGLVTDDTSVNSGQDTFRQHRAVRQAVKKMSALPSDT